MNTQFSFKRFGLLLQRYFYERRKHEYLFWGITVLLFMLQSNSVSFLVTYLTISGAIFASRLHREIHSKTQGVHHFMIPATQLEKTVFAVFMSVIYYFTMFLVAYIVGNVLGTLLNNLLASFLPWFSHSNIQWQLFQPTSIIDGFIIPSTLKSAFEAFIVTQAVFLLGGIYFKRNTFLKTVFSIFALLFVLLIVEVLMLSLFIDGTLTTSLYFPEEMLYSLNFETFYKPILNTLGYLFVPFVWVVSYFRLTEKEV